MGATTFTTAYTATDVATAFRYACAQAGHANGFSYSGTIAEKDSYVVTSTQVYPDLDAAVAYANGLLDGGDPRVDDKWGPAGAVRYTDPQAPAGEQAWLFFGWAAE